MTIQFNISSNKRKELAKAIASWLGKEIKYRRAPTFAYEVDYFTIDREGNLRVDDNADPDIIESLTEYLYDEGFEVVSSRYDEEMPDVFVEEPFEDCPPAYGVPGPQDRVDY